MNIKMTVQNKLFMGFGAVLGLFALILINNFIKMEHVSEILRVNDKAIIKRIDFIINKLNKQLLTKFLYQLFHILPDITLFFGIAKQVCWMISW